MQMTISSGQEATFGEQFIETNGLHVSITLLYILLLFSLHDMYVFDERLREDPFCRFYDEFCFTVKVLRIRPIQGM